MQCRSSSPSHADWNFLEFSHWQMLKLQGRSNISASPCRSCLSALLDGSMLSVKYCRGCLVKLLRLALLLYNEVISCLLFG